MGDQLWEVVGGGSQGGILVRTGINLKSPEADGRLATGAIVKQLALDGERLQYELQSGSGPATGWVSLTFKGKDLVVKKRGPVDLRLPLKPSEKFKILCVPTALKGHIVHQRRIAEWFAGRPGYEIHFVHYPSNAKDLPEKADNIVLHCASGAAEIIDEVFGLSAGSFRDSAMAKRDESMDSVSAGMMDHFVTYARKGLDPLSELFKFIFAILEVVKPDLILTEQFVDMFGFYKGYCNVHHIPLVYIQCPGIHEHHLDPDGVEQSMMTPPSSFKAEDLADLLGISVEQAKASLRDKTDTTPPPPPPPGAGAPKTLFGLMTTMTAMPMVAPMLTKPVADKLGLKPPMWSKIRKAIEEAKEQLPTTLFPSSQTMVQKEEGLNFFTLPLIPMPQRLEDGSVQRDEATFRKTITSLEQGLLDWMFSGEETLPIVYMAFGTMVRPTADLFQRLVEALSDGPWRVLWALPKDTQHLVPEGLSPEKWRVESFVPQVDVLKSDRVRAFISHCGMNSTTESLVAGVPMVCCPFYMDQYEWASTVCNFRKAGVQIDKHGSPASIRKALEQVLNVPAYRDNARIASELLMKQSSAVLGKLGADMAPPTKLGLGTSVTAALFMILIRGYKAGKDHADKDLMWKEVVELLEVLGATAAQASEESPPLNEIPKPEIV
mmetsp:Transcript_41366/g.88123  ORF Transcript_41366/g.88123 Transcript_41366/m.88123 type:complete len:663 (+) Transcript_41366:105-2093(+)